MTIREIRALRGPNVWARTAVLEAEVDLGDLAGPLSAPVSERLRDWLRSLTVEPTTGGDPLEPLPPEVDLAHALADAAVWLQVRAGSSVTFRCVGRSEAERVDHVVVGYEEEDLARACLASALEMGIAVVRGLPYDVTAEVGRLRELAGEVLPGPTTRVIIDAARARGIPVRRLLAGRSLFQLGHGARLRRVYASATDRIGVVAQSISQDKALTKELLRAAGLPVPEGRPVQGAEDAWTAACELGTPVVVKPRDGDHGHGIGLNLRTREQVLVAYTRARERSEEVLVERFVPGDDHRLLVIDGRVVAASRRRPPQVVGDGRSTVADLVERLNADPRRGDEATSPRRIIRFGATELEALAEQGYTPRSVPSTGARVLIRRNSHLRNGGTVTDELDRAHPAVLAQAATAARVLGIDIAGIDLVAEDIARPLEAQRGAILEVNTGPGLNLHIAPWASTPRPVGDAIAASLFPGGETGRIPLIAVRRGAGAGTAAPLIALALQRSGRQAGLACAAGLFLGDHALTARDGTRFDRARDLLAHPAVEAAVLEVTREGILEEGLAFDGCDVAVLTGAGPGAGPGGSRATIGPDPADDCLAGLVFAAGAVVLRADEVSSEVVASSCRAPVIYVSPDGRHEVVVRHRARGGRAVFPRAGALVLARGDGREQLLPGNEAAGATTLDAIAAAWALGLPEDVLRALPHAREAGLP
jgi:cyanophycin synthetase